jgi:acyl carrier protein
MQSVVLDGHEAYADITLVPERQGTWHTPPHWIDSVFHLAGLITNGSDASNAKDFLYVTPGWDSFLISKPLGPGAGYRSYVKMFPTNEPNMYAGDVYVFQDDTVVGMMGQMRFRRVPRLLMDKFFSPSDMRMKSSTGEITLKPIAPTLAPAAPASKAISVPKSTAVQQKPNTEAPAVASSGQDEKSPGPAREGTKLGATTETAALAINEANSVVADCLRLIARETGLDADELTDDAAFVELGVDSLMSLVLSEKFRNELQLEVKSSLFLECPSIKELKGWLEEYC